MRVVLDREALVSALVEVPAADLPVGDRGQMTSVRADARASLDRIARRIEGRNREVATMTVFICTDAAIGAADLLAGARLLRGHCACRSDE